MEARRKASGRTLDGGAFTVSDHAGQVVVMNIRGSLTSTQGFVDMFGACYPNIIDRDGRVAARGLGQPRASSFRGLNEPLLR